MEMSRREFMAGLGAVGAGAATARLPVDEMLGGLGRAGARGGSRIGASLSRINELRSGMSDVYEEMRSIDLRSDALSREIDDLERGYFQGYFNDIDAFNPRTFPSKDEVARMIDERRAEFSRIQDNLLDPRSRLAELRGNFSSARDDLFGSVVVDTDEYIDELGELSDDELRDLADDIGQFFSNIDNVDRLKRGGYDPSEIVSSMGRFGSALKDEVVRRELDDEVLGDADYLMRYALPEVAYSYRLEGSEPRYSGSSISEVQRVGGVDEFGFVPDDFGVLPRMVGGVEDFGRGLGSVRMPSAEASQRTQIAGTFPTYEKAVRVFDEVAPEGRSLDYGAGLGKSSELGFDTFEPFAREGFDPTYRVSSDIPDASYERVTNLNVLNVLDPETRRGVVLDIGRVLKPDGVAIITTRGRDVLTAKGERGPEDMSVITTAGTYQKGFTKPELVSYLRDTLGEGFEVKSLNLGPAGALVRKLPVTRPD